MVINDAKLEFRGAAPNGGKQKTIDTIIVHHRAGQGNIQSLHADHLSRSWWGVGYHYYIRKDGSIWKGRPEEYVGSHAGSKTDYNYHSIGICFEGNFETEAMTKEQVASGRELIADIKARHPITKVLKHKDIASTACPGKNFRWAELMAVVSPVKGAKVKVGSVQIDAIKHEGKIYVPLTAFVNVFTTRIVVTQSEDYSAAVEFR